MPSCKVLKKWQMTSCHGSERYQSLTHGVFSLKFDQQQIILGLDRPFSYAPQCFRFDTRSRQLSVWVPELHGKLLGALVISIGYGALTQQSISLVKRNRKGDWLSRCTADTKSSRLLTYVVGFNIRRLQIKHSFAVIISILHATYRNIKADSPQRFNVFFYYCIDKTDVRVCGKSICFIKVLVSEIQSSFIIGRGDALLLLSLWICWTLKNLITC